jgi:hypothetical protein
MKETLQNSRNIKDEIDSQDAEEYYPRIPEGEYEAICYGAEIGRAWGNIPKLFLQFNIVGGEKDGTRLFMACTYVKGKCKKRSKLYGQYMILHGRPLSKKDKPHPKRFVGKMYRVKVRDVNPKESDNTLKPDIFKYSVVDRIIEVIAGEV